MQHVLGADVCGIFAPAGTFFHDYYMDVEPIQGMIPRLKRLLRQHSAKLVIITHEWNERYRQRRIEWLKAKVFPHFGLTEKDVKICETREQKRQACEEAGVTILLEDRLQVAQFVQGLPTLQRTYVLKPKQRDVDQFSGVLSDASVQVFQSLKQLFHALFAYLRALQSQPA